MRPLGILAILLTGICRASGAPDLYAEPTQGPQMIVDNMKNRKRLLGTDRYCIRDIIIDKKRTFGGNRCRVKHGEKHALRVTPGKHRIVLDTISEWSNDDPDLPPIALTLDVEAGDKDFLVLVRGAQEPEIVAMETGDKALMSPPNSTTAVSPAVSTAPPAAAAPAQAEPAGDPYKALERLKDRYDKGVITAEEFKEKKAELLKAIR